MMKRARWEARGFTISHIIVQYRRLGEAYGEEFQRNRDLHGARIQCRAGCSDCCSQLFQITEIEAAEVSRGVAAQAESVRERLRARAAQYLAERHGIVARSGLGATEAWGSLPPVGTRLACPALEDGVCTIYEWRPLICRKFGVPLWNPDRPGRVYACEKNFRAGDEIDDPHLIRIQTGLHEQAKALQAAYNEQGGVRDPEPLTVARAILEDLSGFAPE
ncbi:MAG: YkgJ family cysteine cluster protein [Bryobacteraceae bacterium]